MKFVLNTALQLDESKYGWIDADNNEIGQKNEMIQNVVWGFSYSTGFYDSYEPHLLGILKQLVELMASSAYSYW